MDCFRILRASPISDASWLGRHHGGPVGLSDVYVYVQLYQLTGIVSMYHIINGAYHADKTLADEA
jgi:hypothetical protein